MTDSDLFNMTLLITHYNRSDSLERLLKNMENRKLFFRDIVVSDDGSRPEHLNKLRQLQNNFNFRLVTTPKNKGLGNNLNKGQDAVQTPYTLYIQEDFIAQPSFKQHLYNAVTFMDEDPAIDMVRFYAYFKYPFLKPFKNGFSEMIFKPWYKGYRKFYMYSDHPHLRRSNFLEKFGRYEEGIKGDATEYKMMMSFLRKRSKALFFDDYTSLFEQVNTGSEPSTVKREIWRSTNNFFISFIRDIYRHLKFNIDYHFRK